MFVAEANKKIVAYICGCIYTFEYRDPPQIAEVDNMYVKTEFRRKGVGKKLIKEFEKHAQRNGAKRIKVEAFHGNITGRNFYEKLGFHQHGVTYEKKI